jgi:vacuolar-type H+-ATPase subunit D/Vma8
MQKITLAQAQAAMLLHANNNVLTVAQVQQLLQNVSVTFAQICYVTQVQLAAAHKQQNISKVTSANVLLASTLNAHTSVYARAVRKSAAKHASNNASAIAAFSASANYFEHTSTHCIVQHKQNAMLQYLFAIYNNASSVYMQNNAVVSKQHVAQYCTASAAKALLQNDNTVHNVTHNITHNVTVRTIALQNIVSIKARKQLLSV